MVVPHNVQGRSGLAENCSKTCGGSQGVLFFNILTFRLEKKVPKLCDTPLGAPNPLTLVSSAIALSKDVAI